MSHVELWPLKSFTFQIRNQFIKHIPKHLAYLKCFIWSTVDWFLRYTEIYWPTINWRLHPWLQGWRSILGASQAQVSSLDTLLSLPGAILSQDLLHRPTMNGTWHAVASHANIYCRRNTILKAFPQLPLTDQWPQHPDDHWLALPIKAQSSQELTQGEVICHQTAAAV